MCEEIVRGSSKGSISALDRLTRDDTSSSDVGRRDHVDFGKDDVRAMSHIAVILLDRLDLV